MVIKSVNNFVEHSKNERDIMNNEKFLKDFWIFKGFWHQHHFFDDEDLLFLYDSYDLLLNLMYNIMLAFMDSMLKFLVFILNVFGIMLEVYFSLILNILKPIVYYFNYK